MSHLAEWLLRRAAASAVAISVVACGSGDAQPPSAAGPGVASAATPAESSAAAPDAPAPAHPLLKDPQGAGPVAESSLALYEIDQHIDDAHGTFQGSMKVTFENPSRQAIASLPLLLHPNTASELGGPTGSSLEVRSVSTEAGAPLEVKKERPTLLTVVLPAPLGANKTVVLRVEYTGTLRSLPADTNDMFTQAFESIGSMTGTGSSDYGLLASGDGILTFACAYPVVAPFRDGAFDTSAPAPMGDLAYNGVANFKVRTTVPSGMSIVTNLVDGEPATLPDGSALVRSEGSYVRDFVLVAGRDLERATVEQNGVRITSVARKRDIAAGRRVLDAAAAALASYEKRFGPYPYRELDVAEASLVGGAGGVEFSGLVLIAGMLYRSPEDSSNPLMGLMKMMGGLGGLGDGGGTRPPPGGGPSDPFGGMLESMLEFTVAHEVAHQYFAGLVGNDAKRFPSLDEPAAQYLAGLAIEDRRGAAAGQRAMDTNVKMNYAIYRLMGGADRPVARDTASFRTNVEYAALVYGKAPYAYVALRKKLGDEQLHVAMKKAIERYRFQVVSTKDWIAALGDQLGSSVVGETFARYFDQAHGDEDLKVDDSGEFVMDSMFPPEMSASLRQSTTMLGMKPADVMKMLFGGTLKEHP